MSATAIRIRSGDLLAFPASARRGAASVVSFRMRAPTAGRVAVRVVAAAEGAGAEAEAGGKPKPKKRAASGIMKPKPISPELREFVGGAAELPRTEALKIIWAHIKGNNLQEDLQLQAQDQPSCNLFKITEDQFKSVKFIRSISCPAKP